MTEDEKIALSFFEDSPFTAKDKRVYLIKELVSLVLSMDLTADQQIELRGGLLERTKKEPEFEGAADLVDLALDARHRGLRGLGGTFGPDMTVESAITFYANVLKEDLPKGEPFEFGDSNWIDKNTEPTPLKIEKETTL